MDFSDVYEVDMIICDQISKKYGKKAALSNVSLSIGKGIYGIIGENGAGKSTLLKLLVGQLGIDQGKITVDGMEISNAKSSIGYLPQEFHFFSNTKVYDSLEYIAILKGMPQKNIDNEIIYWLKQVHLLDYKDKKVGSLSGGMLQRLGIAQAFLGNPPYVILDEPTVGLDPKERLAFRNMINELSTVKTIIISTHIIEDIEASCEYVLVLHNGNLLYKGSTQSFIDHCNSRISTFRIPIYDLCKYDGILDIISLKRYGEEIEIRFVDRGELMLIKNRKQEARNMEDAYFLATNMFYRKGDFS